MYCSSCLICRLTAPCVTPRTSADFVKLANSAAGTFAGMTREARESARERLKEAMGGMDFVSREEFDAVKAMAAKAREENEALSERIAKLEAKLSDK